MKKRNILAVLMALVTLTANAQFLFRISGNGLTEPSYMLGTMGYLPGTLLDSIAEYQEAKAQCRQMYMEFKLDIQRITRDGLPAKCPAGKNIFDFIDEESATILKEKFQVATQIDLSDPGMKYILDYTPIFFHQILTSDIRKQLGKQKQQQASLGMDVFLMIHTLTSDQPLGELDDEDMKAADLNKPQTIEEQADSLMDFLKRYETFREELAQKMENWCNYWLASDYMGMSGDSAVLVEIEQNPQIYRNRHAKWLPKMQTAMQQSPTMFAISSAHLVGKEGLIQKLREAGYQVEQVKK